MKARLVISAIVAALTGILGATLAAERTGDPAVVIAEVDKALWPSFSKLKPKLTL